MTFKDIVSKWWQLLFGLFCKSFIDLVSETVKTAGKIESNVTHALQKEFEAIQKNTHDMKVSLPNNDLTLWHVTFQGAKGTLY